MNDYLYITYKESRGENDILGGTNYDARFGTWTY